MLTLSSLNFLNSLGSSVKTCWPTGSAYLSGLPSDSLVGEHESVLATSLSMVLWRRSNWLSFFFFLMSLSWMALCFYLSLPMAI